MIAAIQKRMEPAVWFSLSLLIVTGLFQMSVNVHYNGFLSVSNQWTIAILVKHILVVALIVVSAVQTWDVFPTIRRLLLRKDKASQDEVVKLQGRAAWLLRANLILAILILGATAFMRGRINTKFESVAGIGTAVKSYAIAPVILTGTISPTFAFDFNQYHAVNFRRVAIRASN